MFSGKTVKVLSIILSLSVLVCFASLAGAKTITMKYSDHDPPGGMRTDFLKKVWLPEIEKQTGGKQEKEKVFYEHSRTDPMPILQRRERVYRL